jgi:uncharacterized protein YlxW (UPF0749 family)
MNRGSRMTSISAITVLTGMMKKAASRTEKDARMEVLTMSNEEFKNIRDLIKSKNKLQEDIDNLQRQISDINIVTNKIKK